MVTLKKSGTKIVVLPEIGGRLVSLNKNNSDNILSSDSSLWNHKFDKPIEEYTSFDILQIRGLSTWVSPQSEWWIHQDINQEKKAAKDTWPPDPFLDYGKFEIINSTDNSIELLGPKSKYTGVQIKKSYTILDNGAVEVKAKATNIRNEDISWDLWFNTRLPGNCKSYVNVKNNNVRVESNSPDKAVEYEIIDDYFTFTGSTPQTSSKAFITPKLPYIFAFNAGYLFIIHIDIYDEKNVHPEQGMVEVYNEVSKKDEESLLELEYHSPFKKMKPGGSIEITETWELVKYDGDNTATDHINFINKWLKYN